MLSEACIFHFKHGEICCNVQAALQLLDMRDSQVSASNETGTTAVYNLKQSEENFQDMLLFANNSASITVHRSSLQFLIYQSGPFPYSVKHLKTETTSSLLQYSQYLFMVSSKHLTQWLPESTVTFLRHQLVNSK